MRFLRNYISGSSETRSKPEQQQRQQRSSRERGSSLFPPLLRFSRGEEGHFPLSLLRGHPSVIFLGALMQQKSPTIDLEEAVMEKQYLAPYICAAAYFCFFVLSCSYLYIHSKRKAAAAAEPHLFPLGSMAEAAERDSSRRRGTGTPTAAAEDRSPVATAADGLAAAAAVAVELKEDSARRSGSSGSPRAAEQQDMPSTELQY
ncbi:hypothetical protein Efla_004070 [Eimeria flavescens]